MIYFARGRERLRYKKYDEALDYFLQACYIDACGGSTNGFLYEDETDILKNPEASFIFLGDIGRCIMNLNLSEDDVVNLFLSLDFEDLDYPIDRYYFIPTIRSSYHNMIKAF